MKFKKYKLTVYIMKIWTFVLYPYAIRNSKQLLSLRKMYFSVTNIPKYAASDG